AYVSSLVQTLTFSGDINLTPKWKIAFSSGFDLKSRQLTTTSLNFYRDLHCWEMRLTVIPIGYYKSFSFQINVRSSILQDLKLTKRDHYLDNLGE
ncbi:MAG TPA: LPS-assembly protein LptD, partial [Tenuifilaceae bacterium]|nr:LPS-assembly protein LptD [Tenuifilaceae bacterium]